MMGGTAVETFAERHEAHALPANERYYRDLIPLDLPGEGEQYAFEVDLDACTGCKSCVVACSSLNGLDDDESWRSVGLLQGSGAVAFQQTVTTACHHCVEPACLIGCPVDAYEKDLITGIVSHLDDQCIGCGYCTLTCPYEVPRFSESRGIVRKCDMCRGRLAVGEAPACVQSCPNGAIRIAVVSKVEVVARSVVDGARLVAGAPASALTAPTTTYRSSRPVRDDLRAADHFALRPAHPHPPLAAMLVFTQMAVGALVVELALRAQTSGAAESGVNPAHAAVVAVIGIVALAVSTLHLGRPRYAFRAVLGFSHSWLSREVVAFGAFGLLAPAYAISVVAATPAWARVALGVAALAVGVSGVGCSVGLYAVTRRSWWRATRTAPLFALSGLATGTLVTMTTAAVTGGAALVRTLGLAVAALVIVKLVVDLLPLRHGRAAELSDRKRTALLLSRDLAGEMQLRVLAGGIGGIVIPGIVALSTDGATSPGVVAACSIALVLLTAGELIERHHFFRVAVAPRMPGELR